MCALGQLRPIGAISGMSALPPITDTQAAARNRHSVPLADVGKFHSITSACRNSVVPLSLLPSRAFAQPRQDCPSCMNKVALCSLLTAMRFSAAESAASASPELRGRIGLETGPAVVDGAGEIYGMGLPLRGRSAKSDRQLSDNVTSRGVTSRCQVVAQNVGGRRLL
jgi:hypothetical protein